VDTVDHGRSVHINTYLLIASRCIVEQLTLEHVVKKRGESREQRAEGREQRAESRQQRAESRQRHVGISKERTAGREQRAAGREKRAQSKEQWDSRTIEQLALDRLLQLGIERVKEHGVALGELLP
jgi:hypothetical protein